MRSERCPSVCSDIDVDAEHLTFASEELEDARREYERPAMGNSRLYHQIGPSTPQQFLDDDYVLGVLNDRYS